MDDQLINETLSEEMIDTTLADSFPVSDPPCWTLGRERKKRCVQIDSLPQKKDAQLPSQSTSESTPDHKPVNCAE
jgi:hypothetical protein